MIVADVVRSNVCVVGGEEALLVATDGARCCGSRVVSDEAVLVV